MTAMRSVIMAGGEGTRLRPLTSLSPKPMLTIANRPLIEHTLLLLSRHGVTDVTLTLAYLAERVRDYFGDGSEFGMRLSYAIEESPLGTAGSVRSAIGVPTEPVLVLSGDVLTDIDLTALMKAHSEHDALATIALKAMQDPSEFGVVITNSSGAIERFVEKPNPAEIFSELVNTGVYVLSPEVFEYLEAGSRADFSSELFPEILARGLPIYGWETKAVWEDVGTVEAYQRAQWLVLDNAIRGNIAGFPLEEGVWLGEGATIDPLAVVRAPAVIGPHARIERGARVGPYCVLGPNTRVSADAYLEHTIVMDGAYIGPASRVNGAVIGRGVDIRRGVTLHEGVTIGDECYVGERAEVKPAVRIFPHKTIEPAAVVTTSMVFEHAAARHVFRQQGLVGLINVDLTPEHAMRVARSYAATLGRDALVSVARDTSRAARLLKRSIIAGLTAAGVDVEDLEVAPVSLVRHIVRSGQRSAGITVHLSEDDPETAIVRFLDAEGVDLDEQRQRRIERVVRRNDAPRVSAGEIGHVVDQGRARELYSKAVLEAIDLSAVRAANPRIVLDYSFGTLSFVMPYVLSKLRAEVLALDPYGSTAGRLSIDGPERLSRVAGLVEGSAAVLGAVLSPDGERLSVTDDQGGLIGDDTLLLVLLGLVIRQRPGAVIVLPVSAPRAAEEMCKSHDTSLIRTRLAARDVMAAALRPGVAFAATVDGGYIFPAVHPGPDAAVALTQLLGLLASDGSSLSKLVAQVEPVHRSSTDVRVRIDQKASLMRTLNEEFRAERVSRTDGLRIDFDDGWVLMSPDHDESLIHLQSEGTSAGRAAALTREYVQRIGRLLQ